MAIAMAYRGDRGWQGKTAVFNTVVSSEYITSSHVLRHALTWPIRSWPVHRCLTPTNSSIQKRERRVRTGRGVFCEWMRYRYLHAIEVNVEDWQPSWTKTTVHVLGCEANQDCGKNRNHSMSDDAPDKRPDCVSKSSVPRCLCRRLRVAMLVRFHAGGKMASDDFRLSN